MPKVFAPMPGGILSAENAKIAGMEIERIEQKHGAVKPGVLVKESRPSSAPLHKMFTWHNGQAADKWREEEARQIIRSVRIITIPDIPNAEQPIIRCFVSVTASEEEESFEGQGYISATRAVRISAYREQMLAAAKAEIINWQRKYADLLTFAGAKTSVKTLVKGLK